MFLVGAVAVWLAGLRVNNAQDFLARTIWAEARGEGVTGMEAVAAVIMNRVADPRYPDTVVGVVLQDFQFSAWNIGDPNRLKAMAVTDRDPAFANALLIADRALTGALIDHTGGATHYHAQQVKPFWAEESKISAVIGNHIFYNGIA